MHWLWTTSKQTEFYYELNLVNFHIWFNRFGEIGAGILRTKVNYVQKIQRILRDYYHVNVLLVGELLMTLAFFLFELASIRLYSLFVCVRG